MSNLSKDSFEQAAKKSWYTVAPKVLIGGQSAEPPPPSDTQLIVGCLQRIAVTLENKERDGIRYRNLYNLERDRLIKAKREIRMLKNQIKALQ